jgi:hypothetical protein
MNIRSGYYGIYMGNECKMYGKSSGWIVSCKNSDDDNHDLNFTNNEAKRKIQSAYNVITFCYYKSGKYSIEYISEEEVSLNPNLDTLTEVLGRHPYDHGVFRLEISYLEFLNGVSEIWEERKKIPGFSFNVDKIKFLLE